MIFSFILCNSYCCLSNEWDRYIIQSINDVLCHSLLTPLSISVCYFNFYIWLPANFWKGSIHLSMAKWWHSVRNRSGLSNVWPWPLWIVIIYGNLPGNLVIPKVKRIMGSLWAHFFPTLPLPPLFPSLSFPFLLSPSTSPLLSLLHPLSLFCLLSPISFPSPSMFFSRCAFPHSFPNFPCIHSLHLSSSTYLYSSLTSLTLFPLFFHIFLILPLLSSPSLSSLAPLCFFSPVSSLQAPSSPLSSSSPLSFLCFPFPSYLPS